MRPPSRIVWIALGFAALVPVLAMVFPGAWRGLGSAVPSPTSRKASTHSGTRPTPDAVRLSAILKNKKQFDERLARWQKAIRSRMSGTDHEWRSGATTQEIAGLEKWAGQVPIGLRRLLTQYNGQEKDPTTPLYWVNRLLSAEEIIRETDQLQEINEDVGLSRGEIEGTTPVEEAAWWHKDLILFLSDDNGGGVAVDRKTGAVWDWDHDGGMYKKLAPDISTFFELMAAAYEEGRFTVEDAGDLLLLPALDPETWRERQTDEAATDADR